MYGTFLSVLLLGIVPVAGQRDSIASVSSKMHIAAPSLNSTDSFLVLKNNLTASGVVIIDLQSGQMLFAEGEEQKRPMASLTKLMTALLIVEGHEMDEIVRVSQAAADTTGTTADLPAGESFTVADLLSAMLIPSANDASIALAEFHAGSVDAFVVQMNSRAKELGLKYTSFENPVGLDDSLQESTPRDLAWLAMYVLRHDAIRTRMATSQASIRSIEGTLISLTHTHRMLDGSLTDISTTGAVVSAGKTGTTDAAGQCLLSVIEAGGRRYIAVLLGSRDRYHDMQQILDVLNP